MKAKFIEKICTMYETTNKTDSRIPKHQCVKVLYRENAIIGARNFYKNMFLHSYDYAVPTGDKWQSKTLFLAIYDPLSSIVKDICY